MSYTYQIYNYGVATQASGAPLNPAQNLYSTVDGTQSGPANVSFSFTKTTPAGALKWADAGSSLLLNTPTAGSLSPGAVTLKNFNTSGLLYLFFAPDPSVTSGTVEVSVKLFDGSKQISIKPFAYSVTNQWSISVANNTIFVTVQYNQLFSVQLSTTQQLAITSMQFSSQLGKNQLLLQALSAQPEPQGALKYPSLRERGLLTRDMHNLSTDTGKFQSRPLLSDSSVTPSYIVAEFGLKPRSEAVIEPGSEYYYVSADTSESSEALATGVVTEPPYHTLTADSNQPVWSGAGILGTEEFVFRQGGVRSPLFTVFFAPLIIETPEEGVKLRSTSTTLSVFASGANAAIDSNSTEIGNVNGWSLASSPEGVVISAPNPPNAYSLYLPYIQLAYVPQSNVTFKTAVPITRIKSEGFPMQAFAGSNTAVALSSDITSPCYNFKAVREAQVPLYRDAYGNNIMFGDNASFTLSSVGLEHATASLTPYSINTLQGSSTPVGPYMVEQRVSDGGTWYTVPQDAKGSPWGPTRYTFKEYVPQAGEYASVNPKPTSVILLYAENIPTDPKAKPVTGYVSCATSQKVTFAPTAGSFSAPLLSLSDAVKQQIQWGLVMSQLNNASSQLGGARLPNDRVYSLLYSDKYLLDGASNKTDVAGVPVSVSVGASATPGALSDAAVPLPPVSGYQGKWLAHGVWMPGADKNVMPVEYDPMYIRAELQDRYNIIEGSGFTTSNTDIQWMFHEPQLSPAEAEANAEAIINAIKQTTEITQTLAHMAIAAKGNDDVESFLKLATTQAGLQAHVAANTSNVVQALEAQTVAEEVLKQAKAAKSSPSDSKALGSVHTQVRTKLSASANKRYPPSNPAGAIIAIILAVVIFIVIVVSAVHVLKLKQK